jgi:cytochrome o ubiquinol oxidase operon protein cyoD
MSGPRDTRRDEIRSYGIGYGLALGLTGAAFAIVHWPGFVSTTTLVVVLGLALVQIVVHFRFFLHISLPRSARDDLQLILFSTLIVILMVSGTLIILFNLRARMM